MSKLVEMLDRAFSSDSIPSERELVRIAENDDPGKDYLRQGLLGKSQAEVMNLLRSGALGNGSMLTEELELAEPIGLRYYLHPFLVHFATEVRADSRVLDDETPFFLFAHLRRIVESRGASVFTQAQLMALDTFVGEMQEAIVTLPLKDAIWLKVYRKNCTNSTMHSRRQEDRPNNAFDRPLSGVAALRFGRPTRPINANVSTQIELNSPSIQFL